MWRCSAGGHTLSHCSTSCTMGSGLRGSHSLVTADWMAGSSAPHNRARKGSAPLLPRSCREERQSLGHQAWHAAASGLGGGLHRCCPDVRGTTTTSTPERQLHGGSRQRCWNLDSSAIQLGMQGRRRQHSRHTSTEGSSAIAQLMCVALQAFHLENGVLAGLRLQNAPPASSLCPASPRLLQGLPPRHELLEEGQRLQA